MAAALFRIILQVSALPEAVEQYGRLLGAPGRMLRGSRAYFDCGQVILALVDPAPGGEEPKPNVDYIYFAVEDLEAVHARARELGWLAPGEVHERGAGEIVVRPWGERSFYARDSWGNHLCFVDGTTLFTGR